jgi:inositol hexakisphosphate/diphosphoinositol-pentakisphosphate kinase
VIYEDEEITEYDEYVVIRGNRLNKPFLEKPINAEDHEIFIHYSGNNPAGAGYSVLFRKTENNSS